jgi:hypothetical protein
MNYVKEGPDLVAGVIGSWGAQEEAGEAGVWSQRFHERTATQQIRMILDTVRVNRSKNRWQYGVQLYAFSAWSICRNRIIRATAVLVLCHASAHVDGHVDGHIVSLAAEPKHAALLSRCKSAKCGNADAACLAPRAAVAAGATMRMRRETLVRNSPPCR